jgi:hypothetical protein
MRDPARRVGILGRVAAVTATIALGVLAATAPEAFLDRSVDPGDVVFVAAQVFPIP